MNKLRAVLGRAFDIRSGEWKRLALLYMFVFALNASVVWGQAASESLFLQRPGGMRYLPLMFIADAILTLLAIAFYGAFVDRISNTFLMIGICIGGGIALVIARVGLVFDLPIVYPVLYLLQCVLKASISIHAWTYIADFYNTRMAKRHYPLISSGSRTSGILAGLLTIPIVGFFGAQNLVLAWVVALIAAAWLSWSTPRRVETESSLDSSGSSSGGIVHNMREGFSFVTSSGFLRLMAIAAVVGTVLLYLLSYEAQAFFTSWFTSADEQASFYGLLGAIADLITLPIQMFILSRIVGRLGVNNANLIFPGLSALSYGLLTLVPTLSTAAFARIDQTALRSAFRTPIDSLLFNAVPLAVKGRARAFINGMLVPLGAMLAGVLTLIAREGWLSNQVLIGIGLVIAAAYILVSIRLRSEYTRALVSMLEQDDFSFLLSTTSDITVTDSTTFNWLVKKLDESTSDEFTIFMSRLLSEVGGDQAIPVLARVARDGDAHIRSTVFDILRASDVRNPEIQQLYAEFLEDPDGRVRHSAISGLQHQIGDQDERFLTLALEMLHDSNLDVRALVIAPLAQSGDFFYLTAALQSLNSLVESPDPEYQALGIRVLGQIGDSRFIRNLLQYLRSADDQVRLQAAIAIDHLAVSEMPDRVANMVMEYSNIFLNDPVERVRQAGISVLSSIDSPETHRTLVRFLNDSRAPIREAAIDSLVRIGQPVVPVMLEALESPDLLLRKSATQVLSTVDRVEYGHLIYERIDDNLLAIYTNHARLEALGPCEGYSSISVLQSMLREENQLLTDEVFDLLSTTQAPESVEVIRDSLENESALVRANAAEALESLTTPQMARLMAPLFDPEIQRDALVQFGTEVWSIEHLTTSQVVQQLATDPNDPWMRATVTFALGEMGAAVAQQEKKGPTPPSEEGSSPRAKRRPSLAGLFDKLSDEPEEQDEELEEPEQAPAQEQDLPQAKATAEQLPLTLQEIQELVKGSLADVDADVRIAAHAAERMIAGLSVTDATQKEEAVLATIERIIFLKEVSLFQDITVEYLKVLANICEEELYPEDTVIFHEGDPGGAMFIIVSGRVAIEREGQREGSVLRLATLEAHSVFGEVSLFDRGTRSAAARAVQDTLTLKMRGELLTSLTRQYPELSVQIISVLSQRLRDANDRIAQLTRSKPRELQQLYDKLG